MHIKPRYLTRFSAAIRNVSLGLVLSAMAPFTFSAVPNIFSNGTTADADEVNANFSFLDDLIAQYAAPGIGTVNINCGSDPDALQAAIDDAPAKGLNITVTGACNGASLFGKRNIFIDGQGTTTITGANRALDIGGSQLISLSGLTAISTDISAEAIVVGASIVIMENVSANNSGAGSEPVLGVYSGAKLFTQGSNSFGDADDALAITLSEHSAMIVEGSLTVTAAPGGTALELDELSLFDQDSRGNAGDTVNITGHINAGSGSIVQLENGTQTGHIILVNSNFAGATETGQTLSLSSGIHVVVNGVFDLSQNNGGGALSLSSLGIYVASAEFSVQSGGLSFPVIPIEAVQTGLGVTRGLTLRSRSGAYIAPGVSLNGGTADGTIEIDSFSTFVTETAVDETVVHCVTPAKVHAVDDSGGGASDDLCVPDAP